MLHHIDVLFGVLGQETRQSLNIIKLLRDKEDNSIVRS
jgi:hypothetical protein